MRSPWVKYTIAGESVDENTADALPLLLYVHSISNPHSTDEMLHTDKPRKVGETWKADPAQMAKARQNPNIKISENDISGETTLTDATPGEHGPILHLKSVDYIKKLHGDWNQNARFNNGESKGEWEWNLPEDVKIRGTYSGHSLLSMNGDVSVKFANGMTGDFTYEYTNSVDLTFVPIP